MKVQAESRCTALLLPLTSALDREGWSTPRSGSYTPVTGPVPIVYEAGWAPGPVWTGTKNLAPPTRITSPDRPDYTETQYRLSCTGPYHMP